MPFVAPSQLPVKEPLPGWRGRFFHSDHMTFTYYEVQAGSRVHRHHHPEEEVWHVVEGELAITLGESERVVHAGEAVVVPADTEHAVRAERACRAIVVDHPVRTTIGGLEIGPNAAADRP
jgi:quercetin dioxygenase-like cupin family protein